MKYVKGLMLIFGISFLGEGLNSFIPLPIPSSVYGLILMVIVLASNQQLLKDVEVVGNFFLDTMAIMFLPGTIGIMNSYSEVSDVILPILTICILSTIAVMCATGRVSQKIIQKEGKSK